MLRRTLTAFALAAAVSACVPSPAATNGLPAAPPWPKPADTMAKAQAAGVEALPNGHATLALHIHPQLEVYYNGAKVTVPAEVGIDGTTMTEVHTHDASGRLHLEAVTAKEFRLGQFFALWGVPLTGAAVTADGQPVADPANLVLKDHQQIVVRYGTAQ